jgi:diguanylate cyclase (GGDEF)-like protein
MGESLSIADILEAGFDVLSVVAGIVVIIAALRIAPKLRLSSHRLALMIFFATATVILTSEVVEVFASFSRPSTLADAAEEFTELFAICSVGVGLSLMRRAERKEISSLRRSANFDELTGLANRYYFRRAANRRIDLSQDHGVSLSCIMLDVDNFKPYNDRHGHEAGDRALQHVARVLHEETRADDLVARYGGEEFVLLVSADAETAVNVAERIRRAVERGYGAERESYLARRVTVSLGVATLTEGMQTLEQLVRAADAAMYHSKREGKNRVSVRADFSAFMDGSSAS